MKILFNLHSLRMFTLLATVLIGCQPQSTETPDIINNSTQPSSTVSDLEIHTGFSAPKMSRGTIKHNLSKPLNISFWCVAGAEPTVTLTLNATDFEMTKKERKDLETKYSDYPFRSGYVAKIPPESLRPTGNQLLIQVNGETEAELMFAIIP